MVSECVSIKSFIRPTSLDGSLRCTYEANHTIFGYCTLLSCHLHVRQRYMYSIPALNVRQAINITCQLTHCVPSLRLSLYFFIMIADGWMIYNNQPSISTFLSLIGLYWSYGCVSLAKHNVIYILFEHSRSAKSPFYEDDL